VLKEEDHVAIVFKVFNRYIKLMRKIQRTYFLEPAGSHGVWSLDDYQFLPFFFGSAQLIGHPHILPKSSRSKEIVEGFESDYMYFGCINFILTVRVLLEQCMQSKNNIFSGSQVKTGPFGEHSPVLNSVAEVPNWEKVNQGMMKMYLSEVIGKFPVFQHQLFGSLFPFSP
jgi:serine/threonine-protein phosphatase 2A activator